MAYGDVRVCRKCGAVSLEDDRMWDEPERCPKCGSVIVEQPEMGEEPPDEW
jgi:predicted Zn-ribbon and HTH transcriptional regulator